MSVDENTPPAVPVPDYRPIERFWPYVDLPEQPTDEELANLNPELAEALFGRPPLPFSVSLEFPRFDGPDYDRAVDAGPGVIGVSRDWQPAGRFDIVRGFYPQEAIKLRDLFEIVGRCDACEVLSGRPACSVRARALAAAHLVPDSVMTTAHV